MPSLPVVAIVGRPNVGKSSLLNALVGKRISIVQDMPGVTRDRITIPVNISGRYVELMDTGGYGFVDPDALTEHIKHQIELAMTQAALVLFVVDTHDGLTSADETIASLLRRKGIKTVLIANKDDGERHDATLADFARLGFGTPLGVSAMNDRNIGQVYQLIEKHVDLSNAPTEPPAPQMLVAIVGKRNAGKSTLVNAIAEVYEGHGDRVIVSEIPGTTRDSIDVRFEKEGKTLVVIDTAGVRKKRHMVTNDIEFYSFHRAERSIRRADVVLMLIDATEPVSEPDKKLAAYIASEMKPVILVINKWDLAKEKLQKQSKDQGGKFDDHGIMEEYHTYLDEELKHLDYAPIAFTTAKDGRNVQGVVDLAQHLFKQANERVSTSKLNTAIEQIFTERRPSTASGRRARIYYATQTDVAPPTIVLFVNKPEYFNDSYQRFMINRFRELLPYGEVPINLQLRGRDRTKSQGPGESLGDASDKKRPLRAGEKVSTKARRKGGSQTRPTVQVRRPVKASGKAKRPSAQARRPSKTGGKNRSKGR